MARGSEAHHARFNAAGAYGGTIALVTCRSLLLVSCLCSTGSIACGQQTVATWQDQFTFEMEIGQGAFGSVWKVRDGKGKSRALKVMHKDKYKLWEVGSLRKTVGRWS